MFDDRALIFRLSLRVAEGLFKSGGALKVHEALARERRLSLRCFFCAQETSLSWPISERTLSAGIIPLRISLAEILQPPLFQLMGRKYIDYLYPFRKATNRITSCPLGSSPQKARHRFAVQSPL